jgi:DNA-binding transcriptional regulator PaaX
MVHDVQGCTSCNHLSVCRATGPPVGLNPSRIQAFQSRTEIITKYREFPFRDPMLPPGLRPEPWPGVRAYETFRGAHEQLGPLARAYASEIIGREVPEPPPVDRLD